MHLSLATAPNAEGGYIIALTVSAMTCSLLLFAVRDVKRKRECATSMIGIAFLALVGGVFTVFFTPWMDPKFKWYMLGAGLLVVWSGSWYLIAINTNPSEEEI